MDSLRWPKLPSPGRKPEIEVCFYFFPLYGILLILFQGTYVSHAALSESTDFYGGWYEYFRILIKTPSVWAWRG